MQKLLKHKWLLHLIALLKGIINRVCLGPFFTSEGS